MTIYVYVMRSEKDQRFYVGMTSDVSRRLKEHNSGKTRSTKAYRPWVLFFTEVLMMRRLSSVFPLVKNEGKVLF